MAAETANYGLKKPGAEDFYNIEDFNWNADVIDAELAKRAELGEDGKVPAAQLPAMDFDPAGSAAAVQTALSGHTGDNVRHLTAAERTAWNAKAAGDHTHTAAQVGAAHDPEGERQGAQCGRHPGSGRRGGGGRRPQPRCLRRHGGDPGRKGERQRLRRGHPDRRPGPGHQCGDGGAHPGDLRSRHRKPLLCL